MSERSAAHRRCPWLATGLLAALAVVLLLTAVPRRSPPREAPPSLFEPELLREVALVLAPPDDGRPLEARRLIDGLKRLGPKALPVAIALVCGLEALPEISAEGESAAPVHPAALGLREQVLRAVIAESSPEKAIEHIAALSQVAPVEVRRVLFQLLGGVDHELALGALIASASGVEPIHWQRDYIARPFELALQARLAARPAGVAQLRGKLRDMDGDLTAVVARAAAGLSNKLAIEFALDLIGRDDAADLALLQALARAPRQAALACDEAARANVRRLLFAADERVRRAAIDVCGRLADVGAIDRLVAELDGEDPVLVHAAHRALVSIAGADHGRAAVDWERWIDAEEAWKEREWARLLTQLSQSDRGRALAAMRELAAHPLHRDEVALLLCEQAEHGTLLDRQQIEALSATQSPLGLKLLVEALEAEDAQAAQAALEALQRLTGLALGADPAQWRALLGD